MRLRFFTPEARKVFRFAENDRGRRIDDISTDIDITQFISACEKALSSGRGVEEDVQSVDGSRQFILRIEPYMADEKNSVGGVVAVLTDVSALRRALHEAEDQRGEAQSRLGEIEQLYDVSPQAMALLTPEGVFVRANQRLSDFDGVEVEDHAGKRLQDIFPELYDQMAEPFSRVVTTGVSLIDHRIEGETAAEPGVRRLFLTDWYPVESTEGEVIAVGVNVRDVTEQTEMSMELRRVMQELQHRVKNMLSNVLALIGRARRDATEDVDVIDTLASRIRALSHTHKLLTEQNWRAADIFDLLKPELVDVYGEDRVEMRGPGLKVNARAAVALGMAIHELATNAAKYGAFSSDKGQVRLSWVRVDDGENDKIVFTWAESGGPTVEPQDAAGFGSQLIRSTVTGSLDGSVEMDWRPEGLRCIIDVPYSELSELSHDPIYDTF